MGDPVPPALEYVATVSIPLDASPLDSGKTARGRRQLIAFSSGTVRGPKPSSAAAALISAYVSRMSPGCIGWQSRIALLPHNASRSSTKWGSVSDRLLPRL